MAEQLRVTVVWCGMGQLPKEVEVDLPLGGTVRDAIEAAGMPAILGVTVKDSRNSDAWDVGIFNRPCGLDTLLQDADRVELYRPLAVDPKEARRIRAEVRHKRKAARGRPG